MISMMTNIGVLLVALLHVWFCALEMFFWQKPLGLKTFKLQPDFARQSAILASNQGLYNAFLSAGLFWSLLSIEPQALHLKIFFLSCVVIAGIFGGITANMKILFVQGLPALLTLLLLFWRILLN